MLNPLSEDGQGTVEFVFIIALVVVVVLVILITFGSDVGEVLSEVTDII
jgi:hypothetical protein